MTDAYAAGILRDAAASLEYGMCQLANAIQELAKSNVTPTEMLPKKEENKT